MSACLCTHSYHEIFNFTDVERTNTEYNVHFLTMQMITGKKQVGKYQMTGRRRRLTPIIRGSLTVSVKYKIYSKT